VRSPTENLDKSKLPKLVVNKTPGATFVIQDDDEEDEDSDSDCKEAANGPVHSAHEKHFEEFKVIADDSEVEVCELEGGNTRNRKE